MPKQCPKVYWKYTLAAKRLSQVGEGENKKITCPHLELSQSMKLIRELGFISTNTLVQDHKLPTKEFSSFGPITRHYQKQACSFLSKWSKRCIRGQPPKAFCDLYPKKTHATEGASP